MIRNESKDLVWLKGEVKTPPFTSEARYKTGRCLRILQEGERLEMPLSRPMPSIGSNVHELRISDGRIHWRLIYGIEPDAIIVLSVFVKKTAKTPKKEIENARSRMAKYRKDSRIS